MMYSRSNSTPLYPVPPDSDFDCLVPFHHRLNPFRRAHL